MEEILKTEYASWLEELIRDMLMIKPISIGVCLVDEDGTAFTAYWGDCDPTKVAVMATNIHADAMLEMVKAYAAEIVKEARKQELEASE